MKKVLKRLLLILFLIAIAFIVIVYLFGLPQNIARVSNYESLTTNIWIDDDYISVEEKFLIKDLIPKEQEQSEEVLTEEYRLELPIQNKYGYKIGTSDISSITSNISYFNPSSINNIKYRDGVYIVQIAPGNLENLRQEIQSNNNFIKINYKLKTSNILLKNDKTQNIELKVSTGNSGFQDNYLIVHLEDGVKVLNQDSLVKDESDNTCTISLNGFPKTYIINLSSNAVKGDITSSNENGLIYKYMLDRICDISLVIIAAITLVLVIVIVVIHLKRIVKVVKINPDENKDFSVDPILIEYVLTGKHDVKKLIEHGIYSKKGEKLLKIIRALIRLITLITVLIFLAIIVLEKSNAGYVIMCTGLIFINIIAYSFTKVHVFTKQGKKQYGVALSYKNMEQS
jgi:hypothetical protein